MRPKTPGCENHRHPALAGPIDEDRLYQDIANILDRVPVANSLIWTIRDSLDKEHQRDARRYAHVYVEKVKIEFASQVLWLPRAQRIGIIAHEIGHILTPGGTEKDADVAAANVIGVRITYDRRWPGKGLQTALSET
jgi:hypothetical protein